MQHSNVTSLERRSSGQGFFDRNLAVRYLLGVVMLFVVGTFMHFREPSRELLELNKLADRYVVAQVDFSYLDEELTSQLKQEAARDVGPIYRLNERVIRAKGEAFQRFLSNNPDWRKKAEHTTFEDLHRGLQRLELALTKIRFTNVRTLQEVRKLHLPLSHFKIFTPTTSGKQEKLPSDVWQYIRQVAFGKESMHPETSSFIIQHFRNQLWKLEGDRKLREDIRTEIQDKIEDVYTQVPAGERLIDQGELITAKHVAMMQAMKRSMQESYNLWHPLTLLGSFLLAAVMVAITFFYLRSYHPEVLQSNKSLLLLLLIVVLSLFIAKVVEHFMMHSSGLFAVVRYPLYVPFTAIVVCSLMNARLGLFVGGFVALIISMTLSVDLGSFLLVNILASLMAVFGARTLNKRKDIFVICFKTWIGILFIILSLDLYNNTAISWTLLTDALTTFVFMLFTAVVVAGLLPIFETAFHILTNITLMEYMDPNNELLRRLSLEAPGTYQHSVMVGNLAEVAALAIGANGLFCRVSTLYHDVGKLINPYYFTENQQGGVNMHQLLTPLESGQVIIGHVRDGVALARKEGLPEQFVDIIKEHHGTTLVQWMYHEQCKLMGGDKSLVDERDFRYSGPKPRSRESAIIMIADALEATSRSLDEFNEENVSEMVENIVANKSEDSQFDECLLTFEELGVVKQAFVKALLTTSHSRIKYPYQLEAEKQAPA